MPVDSKPSLRLVPLLAGVALAALSAGCMKRNAPQLAAADGAAGAPRAESVALSPRDDVARRWAAAYAANPNDPKAALNYARSLKSQGLNEHAIEVLKRAYEATKDPEIASELGRLAMEKGDLVAAAPALEAALRASPGDWKLLSAQGALYARKGDHQKAQDRFLAALAQRPGTPSIINNLALSYAMSGKKDEAERLLKTALARGAEDGQVRQNLARLQMAPEAKNSEVAELRGPVRPAPIENAAAPVLGSNAAPAVAAAPEPAGPLAQSAQVADASLRPRLD